MNSATTSAPPRTKSARVISAMRTRRHRGCHREDRQNRALGIASDDLSILHVCGDGAASGDHPAAELRVATRDFARAEHRAEAAVFEESRGHFWQRRAV